MNALRTYQFLRLRSTSCASIPDGEFIMPWEVTRWEPRRMYWALWRADYRGYIPETRWGRWLAAHREVRW